MLRLSYLESRHLRSVVLLCPPLLRLELLTTKWFPLLRCLTSASLIGIRFENHQIMMRQCPPLAPVEAPLAVPVPILPKDFGQPAICVASLGLNALEGAHVRDVQATGLSATTVCR